MTEGPPVRNLIQSFIVRVYRFDPAESRQIVGVVEAVDGSETRRPFADTAQLAGVLCALLAEENRGPKKRETEGGAP